MITLKKAINKKLYIKILPGNFVWQMLSYFNFEEGKVDLDTPIDTYKLEPVLNYKLESNKMQMSNYLQKWSMSTPKQKKNDFKNHIF